MGAGLGGNRWVCTEVTCGYALAKQRTSLCFDSSWHRLPFLYVSPIARRLSIKSYYEPSHVARDLLRSLDILLVCCG
ncbi:MAG: hypothetical protein BJ554DRAFT_4863, partial [Olpidium bornovanus]